MSKFSGIDDSERLRRPLAITTTSLRNIFEIFPNNKDCNIIQLDANASVIIPLNSDEVCGTGASIEQSSINKFSLNFNNQRHSFTKGLTSNPVKKILSLLDKYSIEDASVSRICAEFTDKELAEIANEKLGADVSKTKPVFVAHFESMSFDSAEKGADRDLILSTPNMNHLVTERHWNIRKLRLVYLIDKYQLDTIPKSKTKPLIYWTTTNKFSEKLKSDAALTGRLARKFDYAVTEWYDVNSQDLLSYGGYE